MPCDHLEQETEDGWVLLGADGRWHFTEECDDGNLFGERILFCVRVMDKTSTGFLLELLGRDSA